MVGYARLVKATQAYTGRGWRNIHVFCRRRRVAPSVPSSGTSKHSCSGFKIRTKVTPRGIRTRNLSIRSATRCHCARGARHLGRTSTAKLAYLNSGKLADGDSFCF